MQAQKGNTGFSALGFCFCLMISGVALQAVDNMEGNVTASEETVRHSPSLCAGEQQYIDRRKEIVLQALNNLQINCSADFVPHIALVASGGGQRAAVSLTGFLYQLEKEAMLDTLLYIGGVSGSTWSMAVLYNDPQWSSNMDEALSRLLGPGVELEHAVAWLAEKSKEEHFSLTDIWGVLTSAGIMKQMDERRLSEEASRNATNPYPVYCALEKHCFAHGPLQGKWFEVSPHEAGFTELNLFVETSLLGSKFHNGELMEKKPEMDMIRLQGFFGCALAHEEVIRDVIPPWLNVPADDVTKEYLRVYNVLRNLITLTSSTIKDPTALSELDKLQKILHDKVHHNESVLLESLSPEERKSLFQQWGLGLVQAVEAWGQSLEDGAFKTSVSILTKKVLPLILKWEWGTTSNFLYQFQNDSVPDCLQTKEEFHLIDGGLLINMAYPSFLGEKRDIDLIIAPESSAGIMFETLILARNYAAEVNKPFPQIDDKILEESDWPKDCYVFEGKEKEPTIIYMPLFNQQNCKDAEEVKARMKEFSTFQLPFSQEKINFLLETAKANMKNNREIVLREMRKAALRRMRKMSK
ncbi:LOW QUALITY PROTEIN: cytosolic phospholipase A2 gamma-like [Poeciliopsis prolifica]|uniref:LOW QUALITY PROTEIN: cytosolic phospholipase A2 gamma-like n=1 Tax=Poeciliopsis prolifica TaxID=188132 RepID=UPI00241380BA|nr:LOW QUALITY PROTEIN: cytosolic phospholipase A2 gamma-like [Poeciliopsis prolifica]